MSEKVQLVQVAMDLGQGVWSPCKESLLGVKKCDMVEKFSLRWYQ